MRTSDQKPQSTIPTTNFQSNKQSGAAFPAPGGSRAVFVTQGVNQIQGPTRLEYVPYQRTVIEYEPVQTIEYIPVERKVIQYEERRRFEKVPVQETVQDFYTVEHVTEYIPHVIPQKKIEYVPVQRVQNRVEYYPVEREVVYHPGKGREYKSRQQFYEAELNRIKTENISTYAANCHSSYTQQRPLPQSVYGYSRTEHLDQITTYTGQAKDFSYLSPIDFTRQNISPRVSRVTLNQEYHHPIEKKAPAQQKYKKSHNHKKHGGKRKH